MSEYKFKEDWPRIKNELVRVGQEAMDLAKKGEKEFVKLTRKGRVQVDITALGLKKEHLYRLIGKEYAAANTPDKSTPKLKKLVEEVRKIDKDIKAMRRLLKTQKSAGKKASKKKK